MAEIDRTDGLARRSMVNGQWSMVNGRQWSMVNERQHAEIVRTDG
jgi:hypothetical protein